MCFRYSSVTLPEHERHIVEREQLSCLKMCIFKFSLLLFFCFELLLSQVTSLCLFPLLFSSHTAQCTQDDGINFQSSYQHSQKSLEDQRKRFSIPLRNPCFPVFIFSYITSLKVFEGYDLTKVRINSQTQRFAPKAVYGLE